MNFELFLSILEEGDFGTHAHKSGATLTPPPPKVNFY